MKVLIVRPADFAPKDWRDIPQSFRIVSEMDTQDGEGFCQGFNCAELREPIGLWSLTVPECFQQKEEARP